MAVRASQVTINTTAAQLDVIADSGTTKVTANNYIHDRGQSIVLTTTTVIYVGQDNTVTTTGGTRGFPLPAGTWTFDLNPEDHLYGIIASGSTTVEVLQCGVA
jgi:hypothetical protein